MPNETEDYNNFVRANLPAGMAYSANRYRYNNHSFYVFELAAWYYYYLLRVNSPSNLFSANEVGVWYDPSDLTTLFQDSAGTTPVTAEGQPVGLMLDKSKGLALGAELVTNGDFSNGTTGWYFTANSASGTGVPSLGVVTGGALVVTGSETPRVTTGTIVSPSFSLVVGKTYIITAEISAATSLPFLTLAAAVNLTSGYVSETPSNATRKAQIIWTATTNAYIGIRSSVAGTFTVDNISVRELAGNHATQTTLAQRPTYQIDSTGRPYLAFDGVDGGMVTSTITPAANKAQIFSGFRKNALNNGATLAELSASSDTNNGSVAFFTDAIGGSGIYQARTRGTAFAPTNYNTAPVGTAVIAFLADLAAPSQIIRVNGSQVVSNTANTGTGDFLAYPLYIGRRAGTSAPLNGNLYSLIVRFGSTLTAAQITNTETWVNQKTGAY